MVCGMQADMELEKELRVLHPDPQAAGSELCHTELTLSKRDYKAHPHRDILLRKLHLLIVPLPMGAIFFQTTTPTELEKLPWGRILPSSEAS